MFFDYYVKTPWFDGKLFLKAVDTVVRTRHDADKAIINLVRGRKLIFCGNKESDIIRIKNSNFKVDGSVFINIFYDKNTINLGQCLSYIVEHKEERPLLLVMSLYSVIHSILSQKGYRENTDYIDASILLEHNGSTGRSILKNI